MKKWILGLGIKTRHRIMIAIAINSLIILGITAYYFFQTSAVMSIIINAERIHNIKYHTCLENFYRFQKTGDSSLLISGFAELDSANNLAKTFSRSKFIIDKYSVSGLRDSLFDVIPVAFNFDIDNASLLSNRVKLLTSINESHIDRNLEIAAEGYIIGADIKKLMLNYLKNPSDEHITNLDKAEKRMSDFFTEFAGEISKLIKFTRNVLVIGVILVVVLLSLLTIFLTYFISKTIADPVLKAVESIRNLASGDLAQKIEIENRDEIGQLATAANEMIDNLLGITQQANIIATGDYSVDLKPRSDKDMLGKAIQQMTLALRTMSLEDEKQNWHKSGINDLNNLIRGDQDIKGLSKKLITFLCKYLGVEMGVFYLHDKLHNHFVMASAYAFSRRKEISNTIKPGEGLIGQAAIENEIITLTEVPEGYFPIKSGLGHTLPRTVTVAPVSYQNDVIGIIELATLTEFNDRETEFLKVALENIGIAIHTAQTSGELKILLERTQQQAEELQAQQEELKQANEELEEQTKALRESEATLQSQQEELRQTNEELEEQTKALRASEDNLQTQQEELRVINEELEERTKALERQRDDIRQKNDELETAQREIRQKASDLEMASKYKSEFLANMSHELRTPLNSILVLSQMLSANKSENLNPKQIEFANTINSSGKDLLELINDVLDLSKVESGMMELNPETISLEQFATEINRKFSHIAKNKGIDFQVIRHEHTPAEIFTDRQRLMQILKNFVANALKYTDQGNVLVEISKTESLINISGNGGLNPGKSICFSVKDTGIGISRDKQKLIFEAFKQADGTISRKYGGTGLGLSISKNLAHLLGGEIHLESEEGKGSNFLLYLPEQLDTGKTEPVKTEKLIESESKFVVEKTDEEDESSLIDSMENTVVNLKPADLIPADDNIRDDRKNINKGDKIILIIEDDQNFAQILYDLAHDRDFKCLLAKNGETGLHYADYYKPQAIILDIGLPGISGWEVMERLKENPETRHIPVHFMSAAEKNLEAMKMGAIGYLSKPASVESIQNAFAKIETTLSKSVRNLLIVEDDKVMRKSIADLIDGEDIKIKAVETGKEGVESLMTGDFDCMILDLGLRDISGFDLLEKIRKDSRIPRIPIIIYTGKELTREENMRLQKYADSIIIKGAHSPERLLSEATLFLHQVESKLPKSKQKILKMMHRKEAALSGKKVLIVDDDMRNVFALTSVLEEASIKVVVGRNGREGLEQLDKNDDINLVLMDIMMPEMDGYEAMQQIRSGQKHKKLPIIALTAKAMKDDREKCIRAGASDYLTKPVDTDKLLSLLRVWMYN